MLNTLKRFTKEITVGMLNFALLAFLVIFIFYTLFWPITPAVYSNLEIENKGTIYSGQLLEYSLDGCRKVGDGAITTVTRSLVSANNPKLLPISLSTDVVANPARCTHTDKSVLLPYSMPTGNYELVVRGVYQIIPLRKPIAVQIESKPFAVTATPLSSQIQELIGANNILQTQLQQEEAGRSSTSVSNSTTNTQPNGSSQTTTKNTTTTAPAQTPPATTTTPSSGQSTKTTPTTSGGGGNGGNNNLLDGIIKALGGGLNLVL